MNNAKLLSTLLHLKELKITGFEFGNRGKELHLAVKPYKNGWPLPALPAALPHRSAGSPVPGLG
jgi:hypothetical protein